MKKPADNGRDSYSRLHKFWELSIAWHHSETKAQDEKVRKGKCKTKAEVDNEDDEIRIF
jgi:hypothetical protein